MKILDVGCGDRPTGDVNLDLFYYGKWQNLVIGEAHHIPFKNNVFDKVYSKNCLEHLENPLKFFEETKRVLKKGGVLECIYPTNSKYTKITIHNLLNLRWSSAFKWKSILKGTNKISHGGHKWQLNYDAVHKLLKRAGFTKVNFHKLRFPSIRTDNDPKKIKWKLWLNKYLPTWQIETQLVAET